MFSAIAGYDPRDPFSVAGPVPDVMGAVSRGVKGIRVAWSPTFGYASPDPEVTAIAGAAAKGLAEAGAIVEEVDRIFDADPEDLWIAEFYAGVGTRLRSVVETKRDLLDPAVAVVLKAALAQEMRDYYDKVFRRYALRDQMRRLFERYDVLLSPTLPKASVPAGVDLPEGLTDRTLVSWVFYTYPFNLTGQPAASVRAGLASDGMPVGVQIVGKALGEEDVAAVSAAIERARPDGAELFATRLASELRL